MLRQLLPFFFIVFYTIRRGDSPLQSKLREVFVAKIRITVSPKGGVGARAMTITPNGWKQLGFLAVHDGKEDTTMGMVAAAAVTGLLAQRDAVQAGASKSGRE